MKSNKRLISCIVEIALGLALLIGQITMRLDSFWGGMGSALIFVGIIFLVRQIRYKKNQEYRESVDVEINDERNKYLSMKAWSWSGYLFVLIAAVGAVILKLVGREELVYMASGSICLIVVLYWISYMVLRKKY